MADQYTVQVNLRGSNQLSTPINQAQQSLRGLTQEAGRANQSFMSMQTVLGGVFAGVTLAGVARTAEELYRTGMEAQRAGNLFRSFGGQVGDTTALLERLRATTRGVVTDTDLMNSANSMLSMGLARTADDVNRLTNIGVTFAQAMGTDVGASLENLNMILANQSYLRLDSLGISSAEVRVLADQYRRAGMDSSEAFNQAFMDVAERKLPQMQAVADAAVTPLQQLQTSLDNWWTDFGNRFAQGVNGLIGLVSLLDDALAVLEGPSAAPAPTSSQDALAMMQRGGAPPIANYALAPYAYLTYRMGEWASYDDSRRPRQGGGAMTAAQEELAWQTARIRDYEVLARDLDAQWHAIETRTNGRLMQFVTEEDARAAESIAFQMNAIAERVAEIGGNQTLVETMQLAAAQAQAFSQYTREGAENLANASLSQLFGQTGGGRLGEIDAGILASLEAGGASADTVAALRRAMGLDTGLLTEASLQFDEEVAPQLTALALQWGADDYLTARTAYEQSIADAAAAGRGGQAIDWASVLGGSTGMSYYGWGAQGGSGGRRFTVNPGDTPGAVAARENMTVDQVLRATGARNAYSMPTGTFGGAPTSGLAAGGYFAPEMFDPLEASMLQAETSMQNISTEAAGLAGDMQTAVDTLDEGITGVFGKRYTLELDLSVLGKDKLSQLIAELVNGAGGVTPGTSPRTGRSNTGRTQVNP